MATQQIPEFIENKSDVTKKFNKSAQSPELQERTTSLVFSNTVPNRPTKADLYQLFRISFYMV